MYLVAAVFNAIIGVNAFQAFWISGLVALIVMGWHNDLVRAIRMMESNQIDVNELKQREKKTNIVLKVVEGCFVVSVVWLAWVGFK